MARIRDGQECGAGDLIIGRGAHKREIAYGEGGRGRDRKAPPSRGLQGNQLKSLHIQESINQPIHSAYPIHHLQWFLPLPAAHIYCGREKVGPSPSCPTQLSGYAVIVLSPNFSNLVSCHLSLNPSKKQNTPQLICIHPSWNTLGSL